MNAKKTIGICLAYGILLSGCAGNENLRITENLQNTGNFTESLQRTDTLTSFAGDSVARNKALQTINPTPGRSRNRHLHFNGQRMKTMMGFYENPPQPPANKVTGTGINKF
jgi:PBP1b-binding outer membrane lipoprotein LpoB